MTKLALLLTATALLAVLAKLYRDADIWRRPPYSVEEANRFSRERLHVLEPDPYLDSLTWGYDPGTPRGDRTVTRKWNP